MDIKEKEVTTLNDPLVKRSNAAGKAPARRPEQKKRKYDWKAFILFLIGYAIYGIQRFATILIAGIACVVMAVAVMIWALDNPASTIDIAGGLYPAIAIVLSGIVLWLAVDKLDNKKKK